MEQTQQFEHPSPQAPRTVKGSTIFILLAVGFGALLAIGSLVAWALSGGQGEPPIGKPRRDTRREPASRSRRADDEEEEPAIVEDPPAPPAPAPAPAPEEKPLPPSPPVPPAPSENAPPPSDAPPAP